MAVERHSNVLLPQILSKQECEQVVRDALTTPREFSDFGEGIRKCGIHWLYTTDPKFVWLAERITILVSQVNQASFGYDAPHLAAFQFTDYKAEEHAIYDTHIDLFAPTSAERDRKLSLVVQLSDSSDYDGGSLELKTGVHPDRATLRQQGSMVIFPSWLGHGVTQVTRGRRFSLVAWMEGPPWR